MKKEIEYTCPHCKHKEIINTYPVINLQEDKELYEDLFSLNLFKVECPECHKTSVLQYDLIVVDMYKKYIIYLTLEENTDQTKIINTIR